MERDPRQWRWDSPHLRTNFVAEGPVEDEGTAGGYGPVAAEGRLRAVQEGVGEGVDSGELVSLELRCSLGGVYAATSGGQGILSPNSTIRY